MPDWCVVNFEARGRARGCLQYTVHEVLVYILVVHVENNPFSSLDVLIRWLWWSEPEVPHFSFLASSSAAWWEQG